MYKARIYFEQTVTVTVTQTGRWPGQDFAHRDSTDEGDSISTVLSRAKACKTFNLQISKADRPYNKITFVMLQ